ncbi:hypothetical protein ABID56_001536 [Alkalibacillus flavidus]|uniref:DUF4199 domain-containing protein n=1 Tax=Alkalibacillus flavidus TaxID=546021 RepID=A0ABV2KY06_9BACI
MIKKWKYGVWIISLLISYVIFMIMEIGTADPSSSHGNRNPFLILLFMLWPVIFIFYYLTTDITARFLLQKKSNILNAAILVCSLLAGGILYFLIRTKASAVINALEKSSNEAYIQGLNQFTNSIYFNHYTFLLTVILCIMLGSGISFLATKFKSNYQ